MPFTPANTLGRIRTQLQRTPELGHWHPLVDGIQSNLQATSMQAPLTDHVRYFSWKQVSLLPANDPQQEWLHFNRKEMQHTQLQYAPSTRRSQKAEDRQASLAVTVILGRNKSVLY